MKYCSNIADGSARETPPTVRGTVPDFFQNALRPGGEKQTQGCPSLESND
jgi:hypothetical protein